MDEYQKEIVTNIKRNVKKLQSTVPLDYRSRSVIDLVNHLETLVQTLERTYE